MSRGYQALDVDGMAVESLMKGASTLEEFRRYQAVHLRVNEGMDAASIARAVGLSQSTVHNIHSRCRQGGLEAIRTKGRGGRYHSYLSIDEEKAILAEVVREAERGGVLEVSKVHQMFEEKVGHTVAKNTTYQLLHRHGWRKIAPRGHHPAMDKQAQEAFKKTGQTSSERPGKKPKSKAKS